MYFPTTEQLSNGFKAAAPRYWVNSSQEKPKATIEVHSAKYFVYCTLGGALAAAPTHAAITPLDLVKCRLQVQPQLYKSTTDGLRSILRTEGFGMLFTGLGATAIGYALQGGGNYGLYELFKYEYTQLVGEQYAAKFKTGIYLAAAATGEFLSDILLCPWEAIKVRTQTRIPPVNPGVFAATRDALSEVGTKGLFKGLGPLWARQIPYTMVKFATFEDTVSLIYSQLPYSKDSYSKLSQTGVSFLAGYIAGVFCAIVSNPADVMVSKINSEKKAGESIGSALGRIYGQIGFRGLWAGLNTRIIMIGSITGVQWLLYDSFKASVGLPTTGGEESNSE